GPLGSRSPRAQEGAEVRPHEARDRGLLLGPGAEEEALGLPPTAAVGAPYPHAPWRRARGYEVRGAHRLRREGPEHASDDRAALLRGHQPGGALRALLDEE